MAVKISGITWNRNHGIDVRKKAQNHMAKNPLLFQFPQRWK